MERYDEKYKIDFKYNWGVFWDFLKNYKFITVLLILMVTFNQGIYVFNKYLFKVIVDNGAEFTAGTLLRSAFVKVLLIVGLVFLVAVLINTIITWFQLHYTNILQTNLTRDLRKKYFNHILGLDHNFHTTHKTGSLISRLMRGSGAIVRMTDIILFSFAPPILEIIIIIITIGFFSIIPALVIISTFVIFVSFSLYMQRLQEPSKVLANKTEDLEKGITADLFTNIDSIKYFGKDKSIRNKYLALIENSREKVLKNENYFRWMAAGQVLIIGLGILGVVYFPIIDFLDSKITIGTLVFIYTIYLGLIGSMFNLIQGIRGYYRVMADFQDLFYYGKIKKDIIDKPGAEKLKIKNGVIEFKDISFNFGKRKIFENFNLKINKNEKVAFVGHSGCGKTTLVKLLYRFYDLKSGKILVDNVDIADVKQESLREAMSMVPQECILFDDTIYNNVAFSNPKATKEEVRAAIKFAQLDKIIEEFENKEKTIVGERGVKLSGGEKQRVSIARAILADKKILVLDEATSALDSETEYEIQKDLQELMIGRTSIIIAHRLSTIMHADKIVVMKKGKIVQMGKHNELIKQEGEYRKLWNLQKGGYIK